MFRRLFFLGLLTLAATPVVRAETPTVTAVLTRSETIVGRPVQLQIKVSGDSNATRPNDISLDGLEIHFGGESQLVETRNFHFSYSVVYSYTVLPLKAGTFTIPPQAVRTSNGEIRTPALTLNVSPNDGASASGRGRNGASSAIDERKIVFAELVIPKTSAYVGEVVPVEVRIGYNSRIRSGPLEPPHISGQGFTTQPLSPPQQSVENVGGSQYNVLTYKTAISAARSGKLEIGPVEAKAVAAVPRRSSGSQSPFDVFGMNDPFSDPFFNDPFAGALEQRQLDVKSQPVNLEVKPLPPNAPASFAGAVGIFNLTTEVNPKTAQVGDPFTVTARISGRGNFDRVTAPTVEEDRGWHAYPPSANFKADDDVGLSGSKTFEIVLTPNENKTAIPPLAFTYFDPLKESYVTLKGEKLPVVVEGAIPSTPAPAIASASLPPPLARPTPAAQANDILYQLTDSPHWKRSFAPLYLQPVFWTSQAVPLLGLIGFFGWKTRQRRLANREGQRRAAWEQETADLQKKLRRGDEPAERYFAGALRMVQLKTALARRVEPNNVDAETAVAAFQLDAEKQERVRELFRRSDEVRYSGGHNGHGAIDEQTRREVMDLIENLS
ncbi:MAG: protein BatD [Chthoniobacterales bacterium]|nr:protein BatD [Chthoniobacterales bacterium]